MSGRGDAVELTAITDEGDLDLAGEPGPDPAVLKLDLKVAGKVGQRRLAARSSPALDWPGGGTPPIERGPEVVVSTGMHRTVGFGLALPWMAVAGCLLAPLAFPQVEVRWWTAFALGGCWLVSSWLVSATLRSHVDLLDDGTLHLQGLVRSQRIHLSDVTKVSVDPPPCPCGTDRCGRDGLPPIVTLRTPNAVMRLRSGWWRSEQQLFTGVCRGLSRHRPGVDAAALRTIC
jgi:hypothetical protein